METKILKPSKKNLLLAAKEIASGENIIFPTETVYGLGANAYNDEAVLSIFLKKGREQDNPLIIHVSSKKQIEEFAVISNDIEKKLIKKCMPGPISIVLNKKTDKCERATCYGKTVAVRFPKNKVAVRFISACACPICAPSANTSRRPSPTTALDAFEDMNEKVKYIIDGGTCSVGVESTVVKVENNAIYILRPGKYSAKKLKKITKVNVIDKTTISNEKIESPGTKYPHYMPKVQMIMVKNDIENNIKACYERLQNQNINPVILCCKKTKKHFRNFNCMYLGNSSEEACKNLFKRLRQAEKKYGAIIAEYIDYGDMKEALFNRMSKSASGNII